MDDMISKQAAIDAVNSLTYPSSLMDVKRKLIELPSAQPEPCEDAVSRKDMLAELDEWREAFDENGHKESCSDMKLVRKSMALLPSAQPYTIHSDGRLWITVDDIDKVNAVVVDESKSKFCKQFYLDAEPEIIRCKDCKHYGRADKRRFFRGYDCLDGRIASIVPDKDFCSRAERREVTT